MGENNAEKVLTVWRRQSNVCVLGYLARLLAKGFLDPESNARAERAYSTRI